ncbi:MAG: hypothetical protein H8D78_13755 [Chloroflexi bacterium]|nr:hypothetical protein [Chloroflexota bacterium]
MAEKPKADQTKVQEAGVAYAVERGAQVLPLGDELLSVVRGLPEEKVRAVLDFARFLNWQQAGARRSAAEDLECLSLEEFKQRIRQRAAELAGVPREQIMAEIRQITEEIRREAIEKGIAIDNPEELELENGHAVPRRA